MSQVSNLKKVQKGIVEFYSEVCLSLYLAVVAELNASGNFFADNYFSGYLLLCGNY